MTTTDRAGSELVRPERAPLRSWVLLLALAEAIGMTAAAAAARTSGAVLGDTTSPSSGALVGAVCLVVAGGLVEGVALGVAQARLLRRLFPALRRGRYLAATVLVAGLGWAAVSAPVTVSGAGEPETGAGQDPALVLVLLGAAALGLAMGPLLGAAQALAMGHDVPHPWRWVGANVVAWPGAMVVIFVGATSAGPGWTDLQVVLLGTATGAAAGALLGIVLGALAPVVEGTPHGQMAGDASHPA